MLQLYSLNSDEVFDCKENRFLFVGSALHCECELDQLPRVAVAIVRYDIGWIVHDLQTTKVSLNDQPVNVAVNLTNDDRLDIGRYSFRIVIEGAPQGSAEQVKSSPCRMKLSAADGVTQSAEVTSNTLVGTAMVCDIPFGDDSALRSRHCLLTVVNNRWHVLDLTGAGGTNNDTPWHGVIRVFDADTVRIGHLTLLFSLHPSSCETQEQSSHTPPAAEATTAHGVKDTSPERPMVPFYPDSVVIDEEVRASAQDLFNTVRECRLTEAPEKPPHGFVGRLRLMSALARLESNFMDGSKLSALSGMKQLLADNPWDRNLMMTFARMCDVSGLSFLCLNALWLLHRQDRNDISVMKSIARTCHQLAKNEPQYYDLSIKYWKRVRKLSPGEHRAITDVIRNLTAEQTTQRKEFGQVR